MQRKCPADHRWSSHQSVLERHVLIYLYSVSKFISNHAHVIYTTNTFIQLPYYMYWSRQTPRHESVIPTISLVH